MNIKIFKKFFSVMLILALSTGFVSPILSENEMSTEEATKVEVKLPDIKLVNSSNLLRSGFMLIKVELEASFYLRSSPVTGSVYFLVSKNTVVSVIDFYDEKYSDGYRWMKVTANGQTGYMQYDPAIMNTYGTADRTGDNSDLKLKLDSLSARIRTSPVNGSILKTVSISDSTDPNIYVTSISELKYSDNYRWMYVYWNGYEGYMQYDPYVMHLYTLKDHN